MYGPAFTLASRPFAGLAGRSPDAAAWLFKVLAALAILGTTVLVARLARAPAYAAAFVGWNPVLAVHLAGGGHNDAWVIAAVVGALALAAAGRKGLSGAVWALAVLIKWVPAVFLLLAALAAGPRERRALLLGFAGTAAAIALLATLEFGPDWLTAFGPLAANAGTETSYALPNRLEQAGLPDGAAVGLGVAVFVAGLAWLGLDARRRGRARLAPAALLLLVTTPWLAAWYTAWAVPLAALEDDDRVRLATLALCAYLLPQAIPL